MKNYKRVALLLTALMATTAPVQAATSSDDPEILIKDGKFFGELRFRYENVDQDGVANDANAHTARMNLGFKTGVYKDFQGAIEAQIVQNIGGERYNSTTNGETAYPIVADPDVTEINEAWVTWSGIEDTVFKVGRQKINMDNQRFVGTVGWRQNDQTFDAFMIQNTSIENLALAYSYIRNVNRIQGDDHPLGDLSTKAHAAHLDYKFADWLKFTSYGYWLDIKEAAALSSKTYGVRLTGKAPLSDNWSFFYEAEAAKQSDHGNNTANYDETYYHIAPGIKGHGFAFKAGYEELGGDGTNSFQTPLATAHKFNGWADLFLATPAAGLEDKYVSASYKFSNTDTFLDGIKLTGVYHDFEGNSSGDFGSETDFAIGKAFALPDAGQPFKKINVLLKYADYDAEDAPYTDRQKVWVQVGVKF